MKLARPSHRQRPLSLLVAAWIIFVVNDAFWTRTIAAFGEHRQAFTAFAIGISALLTVLSVSVTLKYLVKPIYIVAIFSAARRLVHAEFGVIIDMDMIRNAAQTTPPKPAT
jgi:lipid A ethanolaminephosphotransferase